MSLKQAIRSLWKIFLTSGAGTFWTVLFGASIQKICRSSGLDGKRRVVKAGNDPCILRRVASIAGRRGQTLDKRGTARSYPISFKTSPPTVDISKTQRLFFASLYSRCLVIALWSAT